MISIYFLLVCFVSTLVFLHLLKILSPKLKVFKIENNIPHVGGVGFFFCLIVSCLILFKINNIVVPQSFIRIFLFSLIIIIIESIDDYRELSLKSRVIIQAIFIVLFLIGGKRMEIYFLHPAINYIFSFLWVAGIMNAFNLLDIGDGLCGGISLIAALIFSVILFMQGSLILAAVLFVLSAVLLAFLLFNFPPAKMYMGNSGSHFLGFLFATISMYVDYSTLDNVLAIFTPLFILAFPIVDTFFLIVSRSKKRIFPLRKSNDHIFLRLLASGRDKKRALFNIYIVSTLWGLSGVFLSFNRVFLFYVSFLSAAIITFRLILKARAVLKKSKI